MTDAPIPDEQLNSILSRAGVDPSEAMTRRRWPRFKASGPVRFSRPMERTGHVGDLVDISEGGLAFLTGVSLAVGETLFVVYEESGASRSKQATVETVHSHPKEERFLVGTKFIH